MILSDNKYRQLPGKYIRLSITDHGCGIFRQHIGRIFDPFFTTRHPGHGFGLSICYSIVKKHGGFMEVDSEPGNYTTFSIYLPHSPVPM